MSGKPEFTDKHAAMAHAAGLHIGAAVAHFICITLEGHESVGDARKIFLGLCEEMFDETAAEAGNAHG